MLKNLDIFRLFSHRNTKSYKQYLILCILGKHYYQSSPLIFLSWLTTLEYKLAYKHTSKSCTTFAQHPKVFISAGERFLNRRKYYCIKSYQFILSFS